ncbi:helix-turn-helix transcriptional regulator [Azospirillum sp.]|uniref:helix-turn-helix transcriptional regulator n=1 Tax=Azospirillum sp. TaxID=34012 RepID=UPI003D754361
MRKLPDNLPKRCLTVDEAAEYVGLSAPSFERAIKAGLYPSALPLDRAGIARNVWDVRALDRALDRLSGLSEDSAGTASDARTKLMEAINARKAAVRHRAA